MKFSNFKTSLLKTWYNLERQFKQVSHVVCIKLVFERTNAHLSV